MNEETEKAFRVLRSRAQARLTRQQGDVPAVTPEEAIEELHVHRAELEVQNEELRESRTALEASRRSFSELFLLAPVSYLVLDREGVVEDANLAASELLGVPRGRLPGRPFAVFLDACSTPDLATGLREAACPDGRWRGELLLRTLDGPGTWVLAECRPLEREGQTLSLLAALWDVTEQKRVARELARHGDHLEELVADRTAALREANDALTREAGERAKAEQEVRRLNSGLEQRVRERTVELETALGEIESFSYSVAHDLRAPIRAMDGYAALLAEKLDPGLDDEDRRLFGALRASSVRMGHLIDGLLELSRTGRTTLRKTAVDMNALVERTFRELAGVPAGDGVRFRSASLPPAFGDARLLRQVVENLLGNAIKFSAASRPPVVELGFVPSPDGGEYFVRDNGVGFDMRYATRLFGVFQRLHASRDFEGTGIGLALVRRIVERHGGRVRAEGEVGRGATFWFSLGEGPGSCGRDAGRERTPLMEEP